VYEVVFLDLGGVVVDVDIDRGRQCFTRLTGLPPHEFDRAFFLSGIKDRLDVGTIDVETALRQVWEMTGASAEHARAAFEAILSVRPSVTNLAHALCAQARIGVISNTDPIHAHWIEQHCELLPVVEVWTYSFLEQSLKPDRAIYLAACKAMDIHPSRAVLIDDREENCATATSLGMGAVQFHTLEQVRQELGRMGLHQ
jgi:putative hydrolase of the HAD superfamily